ncbi:MAG: hypothetical protein V3V01_10775 [Acidimicrobiales bacterium]
MALLVSDIFEQARDQHKAFDEHVNPPKPLFRFLSRSHKDLIMKIVAVWPDPLLKCQFDLTLPLNDFENGEPFPKYLFAKHGIVKWSNNRQTDLFLVNHRQLASPPRWPAAAILACRFYLGTTPASWTGAVSLRLPYVREPGPLKDLTSEFDVPDYAEDYLVTSATVFLARRTDNVPISQFLDERRDALRTFMKAITSQRRAQKARVRRAL